MGKKPQWIMILISCYFEVWVLISGYFLVLFIQSKIHLWNYCRVHLKGTDHFKTNDMSILIFLKDKPKAVDNYCTTLTEQLTLTVGKKHPTGVLSG